MMSRASLVALAVLFLYGTPAHALTRVSPPGNAGASQYQEDVPSAGGGVPVTNLPPSGTPKALPHTVVNKLDHAGAAGRAALNLAERTAPHVVRRGHPAPSASVDVPPAASIGSQLGGAVVGGRGGGLGLLLPVVLGGSLAVALAAAPTRRRRTR